MKNQLAKAWDGCRSGSRSGRATSGKFLLVAALVLAGLAACDPIFALHGTVTVSPSLQREFSAEHRGRLVVVARHQGGGFPHASWATLCEPSDAPLVVPFEFQKVGCAQETVVEARLERVLEKEPAQIPACGTKGQMVIIRDEALVASAHETVLAGKTGCDDANVLVNLELQAP